MRSMMLGLASLLPDAPSHQVREAIRSPIADAQVPTFEPGPTIAISPDAARRLGIEAGGHAPVRVEVVAWMP